MMVFDNEWISFIHCLLWRISPVDQWVFHRIMYELSRRREIPVNSWQWFGDWPRSSELDAALGYLSLIGVIDITNGLITVLRKPSDACRISDGILRIVQDVKKLVKIVEVK